MDRSSDSRQYIFQSELRSSLKAKLEKLSKEDRRTLSAYIENLLEEHVKTASPADAEQVRLAKRA
jgi:hypothetical protein